MRRFIVLGALISIASVRADDISHAYVPNEIVSVHANKMGPFDNPLETYPFFDLPVCPPQTREHKFPSLGQALAGDELYPMNISVAFRKSSATTSEPLCTLVVTEDVEKKWRQMIEEQYWYQLYVDDLPVWAGFGHKNTDDEYKIYTHQHLKLGYNAERVVFANLSAMNLAPFKTGDKISFTYDVEFVSMPDISFDDRFRRYLDNAFFEHRIHWFSLFNSFMMVLFLGGLVLTVLSRTLRADYARYAREKEELEAGGSAEWTDEAGWKQLANDVFRPPQMPLWLAAAVGTGWQLVALVLSIILLSIVSVMYTTPGSMITYGVLAYAVTSFIAGHVSATVFGDFAGVAPALAGKWLRVVALTACAFPGFVLLFGFLLNFVAVAYSSAQAIPFGGMVVMVLLWAFISTPLVFLGTISGRHRRQGAASSGRNEFNVNPIPRIVPRRPWYVQWYALAFTGGILPFGSIFIELYFVFTSFWNYKFYYVFGFMLLVFVILVLSTGSVAVVSTYFLLNGEDHRWQWASFSFGASTAFYVFLYSVYFYAFKTKMSGLFMFAYYFGYMAMLCCGLALLCGAVAYSASQLFVIRIYKNVKAD